jgi:hypothetical protein
MKNKIVFRGVSGFRGMKSNKQKILEAKDAFLFATPDDPYDPCPCGCGRKWRFVVKGGESEYSQHEQNFVKNYLANLAAKE